MLDSYRNVVVTGGAGFIGRHLVAALVTLGKDVVVLDNLSTSLDAAVPAGARLVRADVRSPQGLQAAMDGADLVFHVAANASGTRSIEDPRFDFETNVVGTFNVMEAAVQAGVRRVVYTSSASVYGIPKSYPMVETDLPEPFMPYGSSKLTGELLARAWLHARGLPVVSIRPLGVYGEGENPKLALVEVSRYLRWHLSHEPIQVIGDLDGKTRDFVHVSDVVQAQLLLAESGTPGEAYNVASGEEVSMRQLVQLIEEATGYPAEVDNITAITDDTYRLVSDYSKLRALGYAPRVRLADGVAALAAHLGENPELPSGSTIFTLGQQAER